MKPVLYTTHTIAEITGGTLIHSTGEETIVRELLIDSRRLFNPEHTLFIALTSQRNDGHRYIRELMERGVRCFLVTKPEGSEIRDQGSGKREEGEESTADPVSRISHPHFIVVPDTLAALQRLAAHHRAQFSCPVIGITGSNGKTIVKEWLYQLLSPELNVIRSPKSYNSQIGVPLSVWNVDPRHELAIIEAGISEPGEMEKLEPVIRPTIGIFTTIGPAHAANFSSEAGKVDEKLKLFRRAGTLIYRSDYRIITERLEASAEYAQLKRFTWGILPDDDLRITGRRKEDTGTTIRGICRGGEISITIPFTDEASIENAIHCWAVSSFLLPQISGITARFQQLMPVAMRLELKEALNRCSLINDAYNTDINSLGIALDFLVQQKQHPKRTLILSDILQTGRDPEEFYGEVAAIVTSRKVDRIIGIGPEISRFAGRFPMESSFFQTTEEFLTRFPLSAFHDETILLKGARVFAFERISRALQQQTHETVLEINLDALVHNLNFFRAKLYPGVKTMAMVKAFSYGSGSFEIANLLQFHRVDYLAVAVADEGVELRKAGITMPVMVMSPEEQSFDLLLQWNLEPEIYSLRLLRMLEQAMTRSYLPAGERIRIHIKLDTGMHRLGFCEGDLDLLNRSLKQHPQIHVQSVFTHLAASEDPALDDFTMKQYEQFNEMSRVIAAALNYPVWLHILNSAGISRFPDLQLDMVRLGIGLYGIGHNEEEQRQLRHISTLRTVITQLRKIPRGETVGYNRKHLAERDTLLAVIPVGYADGLNRQLGNGQGRFLIRGHRVPTLGDVCMDLCMLDVTEVAEAGIPIKEGDEVILFGDQVPVTELAARLHTIPYEIMTSVSRRVKRIYFHE